MEYTPDTFIWILLSTSVMMLGISLIQIWDLTIGKRKRLEKCVLVDFRNGNSVYTKEKEFSISNGWKVEGNGLIKDDIKCTFKDIAKHRIFKSEYFEIQGKK